jgi:zinc transport system substrate-binding protein
MINVAASFYPIAEIVSRVGGSDVNVIALTPPGEGAHDVQLTAKSLDQLTSAHMVFYISDGFQPDIEKAVSSLPDSVSAVDLLTSLELLPIVAQLEGTEGETDGEVLESGKDPHVWLDPANMVTMARTVADALAAKFPELSATFASNASTYISELETLGSDIDTTLANCESRALVTSHRAFAYLAKRANLDQVAISGVNPEEEPSAKSLEAIAAFAVKQKVRTIFFETLLPADLAKTLADKVAATADLLDPIEGLSSEDIANGSTYITVQRDNLKRIAVGLRCS